MLSTPIHILPYPKNLENLSQVGSSYNLPEHGSGGARARKKISAAKKSARPSEDGSAVGFKGGMPSRPSRSEAPPPARSEQSTAKKFSFPFRRKNRWHAQNQNRNGNFFAGHASEASGGGAEQSFLTKFLSVPGRGLEPPHHKGISS